MSRYVFKMPDLGEGTVAAEVVEWKVKVGDAVTEDQIIAEVMTDKAAVEIPAPVSGRVLSITGQPGDMVAVGSELIVFDTADSAAATAVAPAAARRRPRQRRRQRPPLQPRPQRLATRVMASPATRRKAHVAGIDLATVSGSGPGRAHLRAGPRGRDQRHGRHGDPAGPAGRRAKAPRRSRSSACAA